MKITILGASFDNLNLGVGALAAGIVTCIVERLPNADISLLNFARKPVTYSFQDGDNIVPIKTVNLRMKPYLSNNAVILLLLAAIVRMLPSRALRNGLTSRNRVLQHVQNSDLILSIAGGDSFSDIYGLRRLLDIALPQALVLMLGKGIVLLPQTIGPFKGRLAKRVGQFFLRNADIVYARDLESLDLAAAMVDGSASQVPVRFSYDVAFLMRPQLPSRIDIVGISLDAADESELVGMNISGLLYIGGYKRDDAFGFQKAYVEQTLEVLDMFIRVKGVRVLLVPHTLGTGSESDQDVCEATYKSLKDRYPEKLGLVRGAYSPAEMKYIIGRCDFFIGARMHACIAALSQGIPAAAVAYSRKFKGVLETLGAEGLVVDPKVMTSEMVLSQISQLFDQRQSYRKLLSDRLPEVREKALQLLDDICTEVFPAWRRRVEGIVEETAVGDVRRSSSPIGCGES